MIYTFIYKIKYFPHFPLSSSRSRKEQDPLPGAAPDMTGPAVQLTELPARSVRLRVRLG